MSNPLHVNSPRGHHGGEKEAPRTAWLSMPPLPSPTAGRRPPNPTPTSATAATPKSASPTAPAHLTESASGAYGSAQRLCSTAYPDPDSWYSPMCSAMPTALSHHRSNRVGASVGARSPSGSPPASAAEAASPAHTVSQRRQATPSTSASTTTAAAVVVSAMPPRRFAPANIGNVPTRPRVSPVTPVPLSYTQHLAGAKAAQGSSAPVTPAAAAAAPPPQTHSGTSSSPSGDRMTSPGRAVPPLNAGALQQPKASFFPPFSSLARTEQATPPAEAAGADDDDDDGSGGGGSGIAPEEAAFEEALRRVFETFVRRVPMGWAKPVLRAVTLQTFTGRMPPHLTDATAIFDALTDLAGEFVAKREFKRGSGGGGAEKSSASLTLHSPPTTGNVNGGGCSSPDAPTTTAPPTLDLVEFLAKAPLLLRFRLNGLRERRVAEIVASYERAAKAQEEQEELARQQQPQQQGSEGPSAIVVPSRAAVAKDVFRPRDDELQFGAHLSMGAVRPMAPGARLFVPVRATTPLSLSSPALSPSPGATAAAAATPAPEPPLLLPTCASVSFELTPSLFFKAQCDARLASTSTSGGSGSRHRSRRRPINPFFEREFVATVAVGSAAACLFATTLAPEFLVGLPTFLTHPQRCVASAIRATLHRMGVLLTAEVLRWEALALQPHRRHAIRAPPVDMAIAYSRDTALYFAATAGMSGRLFFLAASPGTARLVWDMERDFTRAEEGLVVLETPLPSPQESHGGGGGGDLSTGNRGSGSISSIGISGGTTAKASAAPPLVGHGETFDMPRIRNGVCDLRQFAAAAALVMSGSRTPRARPGTSAFTVAPLLPMIARHWTAQRLREKQAIEPRLPTTAVLAVAEFWSVMPTGLVSDLLRVLWMLGRAAAAFTTDCDRRRNRNTATEEELRAAEQQQMERVRAYIASLSPCFPPSILARLERFYEARVRFFVELDHRNAQTLQQKLDDQLAFMAKQRQAAEAGFLSASQHVRSNSVRLVDDVITMQGSSSDSDNVNNSRFDAKQHVEEPEEEPDTRSLSSQPFCDALAATLSDIAVERAHAQAAERRSSAWAANTRRSTAAAATGHGTAGGLTATHTATNKSSVSATQPPPTPDAYSVVVITLPELPTAKGK